MAHADKWVAPLIHALVFKRHRLNAVLSHNGMRRTVLPMYVKLLFKEFVHRDIQVKSRHARPLGTEPVVEIEAARTFDEQVDLGS